MSWSGVPERIRERQPIGAVTETWRRCGCSRLVPVAEWAEPYGCCDDCYRTLPDSREERFALACECDRDRLLPEFTD